MMGPSFNWRVGLVIFIVLILGFSVVAGGMNWLVASELEVGYNGLGE